jgi:hypothetical protein
MFNLCNLHHAKSVPPSANGRKTQSMQKLAGTLGGCSKGTLTKATADVRAAIATFAEANVAKLQSWLDAVAEKDPARVLIYSRACLNITCRSWRALSALPKFRPNRSRIESYSGDLRNELKSRMPRAAVGAGSGPQAVLWTLGQDFPRGDIRRDSARSPSQARRQRRTKTYHKPPANRSNRMATIPNVRRPFHGSTGKDTPPLRLMLVVNCRTPGPNAIQSVASAQEVTSSAARTRRRRPRLGGVSITAPPKANTAPAPAPGMASEAHPLAES